MTRRRICVSDVVSGGGRSVDTHCVPHEAGSKVAERSAARSAPRHQYITVAPHTTTRVACCTLSVEAGRIMKKRAGAAGGPSARVTIDEPTGMTLSEFTDGRAELEFSQAQVSWRIDSTTAHARVLTLLHMRHFSPCCSFLRRTCAPSSHAAHGDCSSPPTWSGLFFRYLSSCTSGDQPSRWRLWPSLLCGCLLRPPIRTSAALRAY